MKNEYWLLAFIAFGLVGCNNNGSENTESRATPIVDNRAALDNHEDVLKAIAAFKLAFDGRSPGFVGLHSYESEVECNVGGNVVTSFPGMQEATKTYNDCESSFVENTEDYETYRDGQSGQKCEVTGGNGCEVQLVSFGSESSPFLAELKITSGSESLRDLSATLYGDIRISQRPSSEGERSLSVINYATSFADDSTGQTADTFVYDMQLDSTKFADQSRRDSLDGRFSVTNASNCIDGGLILETVEPTMVSASGEIISGTSRFTNEFGQSATAERHGGSTIAITVNGETRVFDENQAISSYCN